MIKSKISHFQQTVSILVLVIATVTFNTAQADLELTGNYAGFQFSNGGYTVKSTNANDVDENWGHLKAKLGTTLNELFSAEGQFGLTTDTDLDQGVITLGGYLKLNKDFGPYRPYGLLGFSAMHAYQDGIDDFSETGLSLGVGLEIFGGKDITVTFEYLRLLDKSVDDGDLTFDLIGLGFTYYFSNDTSYFNKNRNKIRSIRY